MFSAFSNKPEDLAFPAQKYLAGTEWPRAALFRLMGYMLSHPTTPKFLRIQS